MSDRRCKICTRASECVWDAAHLTPDSTSTSRLNWAHYISRAGETASQKTSTGAHIFTFVKNICKRKKLLRELSFRVHCPLTQHESRQVATRRERSVVYIISFYLLIYLLSFFQSHRELTAGKIHFCQFVTSQRMTVNVFVRGRCKVVASRGELDSSVIQVDSVCAATFEWAEWTRTSALSYNSLKRHLSVTSSGNTNIIK